MIAVRMDPEHAQPDVKRVQPTAVPAEVATLEAAPSLNGLASGLGNAAFGALVARTAVARTCNLTAALAELPK